MMQNVNSKIIILILTLIITIIINNVNSQIINIYFSINYGDLNGNGTISNPYQNLCLLNQILDPNNNNSNNNYNNNNYNDNNYNNNFNNTIIINIDYGDYNLNCSSFLTINNFNNISFIPYKSNNNNNNNEIVKINSTKYLIIDNSNVRFDGLITIINTFEIIISNSEILFNNGAVFCFENFLFFEIQCSRLTFSNSTFISSQIKSNNIASDFSIFEFRDSLIENIYLEINYHTDSSSGSSSSSSGSGSSNICSYIHKENNISLSIYNSNIKSSYFEFYKDGCIIDNSLLDGVSIEVRGGSTFNITNSNVYVEYPTYSPIFEIYNQNNQMKPSTLNIVNSSVYYMDSYDFSLISIIQNSIVTISDCNINGQFNRIYRLVDIIGDPTMTSQPKLIMENSKILNFISDSEMINSYHSTKIFKNVQFYSNTFSSIVLINDNDTLQFEDIGISCDQLNSFSMIVDSSLSVETNNQLLSSYITFNNVYMSCVGGFKFQKSNIYISNFRLESFSKPSTIGLYYQSDCTIRNGTFISSVFKQQSSIFYLESSELMIVDSEFKDSTTNILLAKNSNTIFQSSNFSNIIPYGSLESSYSAFYCMKGSILFDGCNFYQIQTLSSLISTTFLDSATLRNSRLERVGYVILSSKLSNNVTIDGSYIVNCNTQSILFVFSFSHNCVIRNSSFLNNHGIGYTLIDINNSDMEINSVEISDNSFTLILEEYSSNTTLISIRAHRNYGIFYRGYSFNNSSLSIDGLVFTDNYVDSVFDLFEYLNATISNIYIQDNYFTKIFLSSFNSFIQFSNVTLKENVLIYSSPQSNVSISTGGFLFNNSFIHFENVLILNNQISTNLIDLFETNLSISNGSFQSNQFSTYLIFSKNSTVNLFNTKVLKNQGSVSSTLLMSLASNIIVNSSEFSFNNINQVGGSLIIFSRYFEIGQTINTLAYFQIENTLFSFNTARIGLLYFTGYQSDQDAFTNSQSTFFNNSLISNHASLQGGAIFTENFIFSLNISSILNSNHFENNTSLCGDNFSSSLKEIVFTETNNTILINGVGTTINYNALDFYNNVLTILSSPIQINITNLSINELQTFNGAILSGKGSFLHTFIGTLYERYKIELYLQPYYSHVYLTLGGCLPFQYKNNLTCEYCPIGSSYSKSKGTCLKCNPDAVTCVGSFVNVNSGYYMMDDDISMVERCANDMCLSNNQCQFKYSSGDLCFSCLDPDSSIPIFIAAKHGINCCSRFEIWLIIPLLLLYLISALILSVIKLNLFTTIIGPIILFLQVNSVVFFSYNGIYILPFFRVSLDVLDGICIFKGLNHGDKTLIIFSIIIIMFIISSSDWFPLWLFRKSNPQFKLHNYLKRNLKKKRNIKKTSTNQLNYIIKLTWQLFQIFIIPLVFNSFTLIIPQKIKDQTLLLVDFSISFNSWKSVFQILISVLIIVSVITILILNHFIHKKSKLKLWDIIIIVKSFLFSILSISLIFNNFYMPSIILIQIVYSTIYFLSNSFKKKIDNNNFINLIQLTIFLIVDSKLFQSIDPNIFG
ncbi:hypothetical protein ACTFIU_007822 [Dictyostelium citrinum]